VENNGFRDLFMATFLRTHLVWETSLLATMFNILFLKRQRYVWVLPKGKRDIRDQFQAFLYKSKSKYVPASGVFQFWEEVLAGLLCQKFVAFLLIEFSSIRPPNML
jgi:hypothetical protein